MSIKLLMILTCSAFLNIAVQSQSLIDSNGFIPNIDTLNSSLVQFYQQKTTAEQTIFLSNTKYNWLKFTPSVGYNVFTQSPIFQINTNDIFNSLNLKQQKKAQLEQIRHQNEVLYNDDLQTLKHLITILTFSISTYNAKILVLKDKKTILTITETKYKNKEITPTDYFNAKIQYSTDINNLISEYNEVQKFKEEILIKAKKADWVSLSISNH